MLLGIVEPLYRHCVFHIYERLGKNAESCLIKQLHMFCEQFMTGALQLFQYVNIYVPY